MASETEIIRTLELTREVLQNREGFDKLNRTQLANLSAGLGLYINYCREPYTAGTLDSRISQPGANQLKNFYEIAPGPEIDDIINYLSRVKPAEEEKEKPKKEEATVPANIKDLVQQYNDAKAYQYVADTEHTIEERVKQAQKSWLRKQAIQNAYQNRQKELERDEKAYARLIDPKSDSRAAIESEIYKVAKQAAVAQASLLGVNLTNAQLEIATDYIATSGISGCMNLNNYRDLNIVSQLAFVNAGVKFTSPINDLYSNAEKYRQEMDSDPYSDKPDEIDSTLKKNDEDAQRYYATSTKIFTGKFNTPQVPDIGADPEKAAKVAGKIQQALLQSYPQVGSTPTGATPLSQNFDALQIAIRHADPSLLRINSQKLGEQTAAILQVTGGQTRNISPEAVLLFSAGLTSAKLQEIQQKNPNSDLARLLSSNQSLNHQISFQLKKIQDSKLGQEIQKALGPVGSIAKYYNSLSPTAQAATKLILDPGGTITSWASRAAGRQIGTRLLEVAGSDFAKSLGNYLLKDGLQAGIRTFAKEAASKVATKVATWAATKLGISIALESVSPLSLGLTTLIDIAIQTLLWIAEKTIGYAWQQFNNLYRELYGEDFKFRDLAAPAIAAGGLALGAASTVAGGMFAFTRASRIAIVSALGIIVASIIALGLYLTLAFFTAPILSTLVQLDSVEKVKYETIENVTVNPNCPNAWPVKGVFKITQGPGGGYSHYSPGYSQAVDIACPVGTTVYSTTDGVVSFASKSAPYLNTNVVMVDTSLPGGTKFTVVYAHLSGYRVSVGSKVKAGEIIGQSGTAGTGAHLHYEYKGIKYNQCPAGGLQLADNCPAGQVPGPGKRCVSEIGGPYLYTSGQAK